MNQILILQSASNTFSAAYEWLRAEYPESTIDVLCTDSSSADPEKYNSTGELFRLDNETFQPGHLPSTPADKQYDLVVVLYNQIDAPGYENVEKFAKEIQADTYLGIDRWGNKRELTPAALITSQVKRTYRRVKSAIFYGVLILLLGLTWPYSGLRKWWAGHCRDT